MCLLHVHTHGFFVTPGPRGGLGCTLEDNTSGPHGCAFLHSSTGRPHQPFVANTFDPSHVLQARLVACGRPRGGCRFHRQCLIHIAAVLPRPIARCTSRLPEHMDATVVRQQPGAGSPPMCCSLPLCAAQQRLQIACRCSEGQSPGSLGVPCVQPPSVSRGPSAGHCARSSHLPRPSL